MFREIRDLFAAPLRYEVTWSAWTRQRRSEYRQTTVQESWDDTPGQIRW